MSKGTGELPLRAKSPLTPTLSPGGEGVVVNDCAGSWAKPLTCPSGILSRTGRGKMIDGWKR